jgi:hypothetical protein
MSLERIDINNPLLYNKFLTYINNLPKNKFIYIGELMSLKQFQFIIKHHILIWIFEGIDIIIFEDGIKIIK